MNSIYNRYRLIYVLTGFILSFSIVGCKKLVEVSAPETSTNAANVFNDDATAASVLNGIYINISNGNFSGNGVLSLSFFPSLSGDELTLFNLTSNPVNTAYYTNALTNTNITGNDYWNAFYSAIYVANFAVEGLSQSDRLTPSVKQQLIGEAKFMRAFYYFHLVNLYGDVPLVITTDRTKTALLLRNQKTDVYQQIITDLQDAQGLLSPSFVDATTKALISERTRPTKWAALALLARTHLYAGNWSEAEASATSVINNITLFDTVQINNVFLKNNKEAIWQLQPTTTGQHTSIGRFYILPSTGPSSSQPVYISQHLLNAFDSTDKRKTNWINSLTVGGTTYYYPFKYKKGVDPSVTSMAGLAEYFTVLRLAELYLIRSEARAQLGKITESQTDLNVIRKRAGLPSTTANDKVSLLSAILNERRVEFFTEWGHRWLDLKRTGNIDAVMSVVTTQKGGTWNSFKQWYPIPLTELQANPNLSQNTGY